MKGDFTRFTHDPTKHYTAVLKQQGRVDLDADWNEWNDMQEHLRHTTNKDVIGACGVPMHAGGFEIGFVENEDGPDLTISPGRIYVDGILCELEEEQEVSYLHQPDYPNPPRLRPEEDDEESRTDLVYLDVWQRHVTAIEDPDIREVALGGPDTATRVKTVWQVKVQKDVGNVTCEDTIAEWPPPPSGACLSTQTVSPPADEDPCIIAPGGGYRGLENRLYRVEIHGGSDSEEGPTFKWSRDNGSVVFAVEEFVSGELEKVRVRRLGRDQVLALRVGDWVEVLGDETELQGEPGTLACIEHIDEAERVLTLGDGEGNPVDVSRHSQEGYPKVRRWDQRSDAIPVTADPVELEDGIQIRFSGNNFKTGDYWVFAARTAAGTIEELNQAPPHGIEHRYCRLALITWGPRAVRTLVSWIEGHAEPGLAKSWEVSEDGLTWTFYLLRDLDDPEAVKAILDENRGRLTGYVGFRLVDRRTIELVLEVPNPDFLEQLSEIPISEQLVARVEDCRKPFPPLTELPTGGANCCTVTVGDGRTSVGDFNDIQMAIDSLPNRGGRVCILPGRYSLNNPVEIKRNNVIVSGCGRQARIVGPAQGSAFVVDESHQVALEALWVDASSPQQGAIRVYRSGGFRLADCLVRSPRRGRHAPTLQVVDSRSVTIVDSTFVAWRGVSVQGQGVLIARNVLRAGGIWVWDGSVGVLIRDNIIQGNTKTGGRGPGIILGGGQPSGEAGGVKTVEILDNVIRHMNNSGISTMADTAQNDLGDVEDVNIARNRITECAREGPDPRFDSEAVGGIVLRNASRVRVHDNYVAGNGVGQVPACGIFVHTCLGLEVSGNTVINNGSTTAQDGRTAYQAGVVAMWVFGDILQMGFQAGAPAARIHDNVVICPRGQALFALGLGPVSVTGNTLTSQGKRRQPSVFPGGEAIGDTASLVNQLVQFGKCVSITNLGSTPPLPPVAWRVFTNVHKGEPSVETDGQLSLPALTDVGGFPNGPVLFHDNQVTLRVETPEVETKSPIVVGSSVSVISFDDVSLHGNQVLAAVASRWLADVVALGTTIRVSNNRFHELPWSVIFSCFSRGMWNVTTHNQATHCIFVDGRHRIKEPNQEGSPKICDRLDEKLG